MNIVKLCVCAMLIGVLPSAAIAQQAGRSDRSVPNESNVRVVPEEPTIPLPPMDQPQGVPQLPGASTPLAAMTLAELEEMAVRCNPTLAQAAARVQGAQGQYVQAGLYPNPVAGYQASEIGNEKRAGQQGGFVGQEVVTAGKLRLSQDVASQEIRQAEFVLQAQRCRVLTDVRRAFYDVLVAQRALELSEQLVRIGEEGIKSTEALTKAKEAARVDVLQARIEADSAKIFLEKARNRYAAAWRNLAAVVGDFMMQPKPLAGNLLDGMTRLCWDDTFNRLLAESPQLAGAQAGVARAQAVLSRECAGRYPNLSVQASAQYDNATQDAIVGAQVGVPLPIFNRNQGNIRRAEAELAAAQQETKRVQLGLQQRLAVVFEQYATAQQQVEKYNRDILPNAEESLRLVSMGYRQGELSYLVLLTSQRTFFQTNLAYLDALRDLRAATTAIEGNLLSGSLQATVGTE
ncbi:MAG: TolC family protein [Planctomycetaceae bacterium]|nr:TolC family protein [Planctomycetaceae bacterium]